MGTALNISPYVSVQAVTVKEMCGSRLDCLPGYYLDALLRIQAAKQAYNAAHAQRMRDLRRARK